MCLILKTPFLIISAQTSLHLIFTARDVTLKDRRKLYYQNSTLICGKEGCNMTFDFDTFIASCDCSSSISNKGFTKEVSKYNFSAIKCYKKVFKAKILKKNIGSFCIIGCFFFQLVNFIVYIILKKRIFDWIMGIKNKTQVCEFKNSKTAKDTISKKEKVAVDNYVKQNSKVLLNQEQPSLVKIYKNEPSNDNSKTINSTINQQGVKKSPSILFFKGQPYIKKFLDAKGYDDITIDNMNYESAIENDKRTFCYIYLLRLKFFHLVYQCIITEQRRIQCIKISELLLGLTTDFTLNAFFYFDPYIHNSYLHNYDFVYDLPKSVYSSLMSIGIRILLHFLIIKIVIEKEDNVNLSKKVIIRKNRKRLIDKIQIFNWIYFGLIFAISLLCWYYVAAFCGVFENSKIYWLYGSLISFLITFLIPFFTALICTALRRIALSKKNKCIFCFAKLIENY